MFLLLGLFFLIVGIFGKVIMNTAGLDFISFGILCALVGFTGYNDTLLLQVLTGHPALIRVITYVCLIFLPYPAISFFASAAGSSRSKLVPASLVLCLANFAVQVLLTYRGVSDYYYLVNISHALILLALAVIVFLLVRAIRRHTVQKELLRSLTVGLAALVAGVVVDIVRYYILQSYGSSSYTRIGVLVVHADDRHVPVPGADPGAEAEAAGERPVHQRDHHGLRQGHRHEGQLHQRPLLPGGEVYRHAVAGAGL